ncbi:serine/threonine protein kinase [Microbacterium sp. 4R-513]|uniref:serine/threonine-protein kinase n=1 Tax=Microbacterium sp. 4R-513 TaxID=2567934 RepID=UPI0013E1129D|nr:serine/threonine-protein kinase [Microbacterium sp. 4R-513]QIG39973.1 serine/threonine protein kinase [Microbacterium sp. 4R-513]
MPHLTSTDVGTGSILDGRYRLDETIGEGGMARVYRAQDMALQRTVAIKVMRGPTEGAPAQDRVRSETTLLASLGHPSLVTLYDAHISATEPSYLVMEFVEGKTLRDRLDQGPLPPDEVAALAIDLAEALHVVHEKSVVHRDIKPSNILLWPSPLPDRTFRAKLTDFGIAYLLDATRVTSPGTVIGTAAYLAPEQVRGEKPSPAADIYGLGLVLLEALTARRAFADAVGHEAIVARLTVSPTIPLELPATWRALLAAMTASNPERRPTALQVALAATELREPRPSTGEVLAALMDPAMTAPSSITAPSTIEEEVFSMQAEASVATPPGTPVVPETTRTQLLVPDEPPHHADGSRDRRRTWILAVVGVLLAIAVATVIAVGVAVSTNSAPDPTPSLPAVEEPLGTHLQDLLDEVTP